MADYIYECPRGCKSQGQRPIASTIRGWKKHMTRQHGGYEKSELDAIIGNQSQDAESGRAKFLSEAGLDYSGGLFDGQTPLPETPEEQKKRKEEQAQKEIDLKTDAVSKKFSGKLNKMKDAIAQKFPEALSNAIKDKGPEWQLSGEDTELFAESIRNCFDVLDIDFRIVPISTVLTNPLWVLLMPLLALCLIFVPKAISHATIEAERRRLEGEPENVQPTVN
jgi:hypothetical protein